MTVYIDNEYRCHAELAEGRRPVEDGFFDGKCPAFVEGWRYIPEGESWTDDEGRIFSGQALFPLRSYEAPTAAQEQYEADESSHLAELGALIEEIYNEDMEVIDNV